MSGMEPFARPTQDDVARVSGFSRTLVSRALRGSSRVSEEARGRILEVAAELGYRPNDMAAGLASNTSTLVGLILPHNRNPFFDAICEALQRELTANGLTLMVSFSGPDPAVAQAQAEQFLRLRVNALLMVSPSLGDAELCRLGDAVPLCLIGHLAVGGRVDAVRLDEQLAAEAVIAAVAGVGIGQVVHLSPDDDAMDPTGHERREALAAAAGRAGLNWRAASAGADAGAVVRTVVRESEGRVALVVHNDVLGLDAVAAVRGMGLEVGRDVAIISYDNTHLAARPEFDLASVDQSTEQLAAEAVRLLVDRAAGQTTAGREITIPPRLVVRSSLS